MIDVRSPTQQMIISLILPNGTEVTAANANSLGFTAYQQSNALGSSANSGVFTPFDTYGAHTTFVLPPSSPGGTYQVKANSTSVVASSNVTVTYVSISGVKSGIALDQAVYNAGNNVIMTAFAMNGSAPVTGAAVSAVIITPNGLNGQATISSLQLNSQTTNNGVTKYIYQAALSNSGSAAYSAATAQVARYPPGVTALDNGTLGFFNVPANGTTTSLNAFGVQAASGQSFSPTDFSWNINTAGPSATVTFADSGPYDHATGDGLYTGVFTPSVVGTYKVLVTITGTASGAPFARTLFTTFTVVNPIATLNAIADAAVMVGGLIDHLVLSAQMEVQTAGTYTLNVALKGSNGTTVVVAGIAKLKAGSGSIDANVAASQLLSLGVDGPYEKIGAVVVYVPSSGPSIKAGAIADAGPTSPYTLASVSRGKLYFTGQNSAAGVVTGSAPTFDFLKVSIGVFTPSSQTCDWNGELTDLSGNEVDFSSSTGAVAAGATSVPLSFNGNKIALAANGPYLVKSVTINCGKNSAHVGTLFQTQTFSASQFTNITPDFTLSTSHASAPAIQGSAFSARVTASPIGPFGGSISLSVSGLPSGAAAVFSPTGFNGFGTAVLTVATTLNTPAGTYPLKVTGTTGTLSHSASTLITVLSAQVATPTFIPLISGSTTPLVVSISTATSGATIRYSTDGSTPSETSGNLYTGPITVSSTTTINAIAYLPGMIDSAVGSATYTIRFPPAL